MKLILPRLPVLAILVASLLLAGCAWLPAAGPGVSTILDQAEQQQKFSIVNVDFSVIDGLAARAQPSFKLLFGETRPPQPVIAVGDVISISVWEAGGGSLFAALPMTAVSSSDSSNMQSTGARPATIPEQSVQTDGTIVMPFVGRMTVAGRTQQQAEDDIRQRLLKKASDPQVMVVISQTAANSVTVTGEMLNGSRVPLSTRGDRILDIIAAAGGLKTPSNETSIRLTRGATTAIVPFSVLLRNPTENIYVWPGDILTVIHADRFFDAFGAAGRNAQIPFEQEDVYLSDALGKAAGLLDERADPSGVFLLRFEPRLLASQIASPSPLSTDALVPVVYRFDFSNIQSYFLAQHFPVQDKDIIYIANARSNSLQKFFQLFGTITSPVVTGATLNSTIHP